MLKYLKVKDFALIEDIEISFDKGLTVLTGETGSGKSIILESLSLIFAKRSDAEMIRHGSEQAFVEATFYLDESLRTFFDLEEEITVIRQIDLKGRHKITLNGKVITLTYLRSLTDKIGNIHSQDDLYQLLDPSLYLSFVDQIDKDLIGKHLSKYLIKRSSYLEAKSHYDNLLKKEAEDLQRLEFYEYQLKELSNLNLVKDEYDELTKKHEVLANFDKIALNLNNLIESIELANLENIYDAAKTAIKLQPFDSDFKDVEEKLNNSYYELTELKSIISDKRYALDFDQNEFEVISERLYELERIEKKYQKPINELIIYIEEIDEKINLIKNYDSYLEKYAKKVADLKDETINIGLELRKIRMKLAKKLEREVILELKDLDLEDTKFEVLFNEENTVLREDGIDEIEFLISLNEGEPLKSLSKVASGGERARFMFAIKSIYAKQNDLKLLVLDEIDIGISGKTAAKMANKMSSLSAEMQLIVITHLPQVAAKANTHFGITKELVSKRMQTTIHKLSFDERIEKIALMLSDEEISSHAINQAKMLLKK